MNSDSTTLPVKPGDHPLPTTTKTSALPPNPRKAGSPNKLRTVLGLLAGLAAAIWLGRFVLHAYRFQTTEDAYIMGHLHQISPQINGLVKEVRVQDNQPVAAGDILVLLDPTEFQIAVDRARSALDQTSAQAMQSTAAVAEAEAQIAQAEARATQADAQVKELQAQTELARLTLARTQQLFRNDAGAATQADLDKDRGAFDASDAATTAAKANVLAARAAVTAAHSTRDAAHAQVTSAQAAIASAEAALRAAQLQLSYATIAAPANGRVGNKAVEVGNRVLQAQVLFDLAAPDVWVIANFKETQLAHMHAGQDVEMTIDALPEQTVHGHLESFAPASGAQFALLPPDNATGNFNKVVQRVPVKIVFDPAEAQRLGDRLRLGLSVVVNVRVRN